MADQDIDELVLVEVARSNRSRSRRDSQAPVNVIDLTEEPDSPPPPPPPPPRANPRRQGSQRRSPPSFHRSDSSILGGNGGRGHEVIDLTADSPEPAEIDDHDVLMMNARRVRRQSEPRRAHGGRGAGGNAAGGGGVMGMGIGAGYLPFPQLPGMDHFLGLLHRRANLERDPGRGIEVDRFVEGFGRERPNLDYGILPFGQPEPPPPRPNYSAKPAREGYTRDTGEETVAVCPNCEKELEYDPAEEKPDATPSKKKGRAVKGEHHFWAVKACGHVFCQECYENRKPSSKNPHKGFPVDPTKRSSVVCAVDGCESEVTAKSAWVGIFL